MSDTEENLDQTELEGGEGDEEVVAPGLEYKAIKLGLDQLDKPADTSEGVTAYLRLKLSKTELTILEGDLSLYKHLQYIHLDNNQISDLSPLNVLPDLLFIDARNNEVESFGDFGYSLEKLKVLILDSNKMKDLVGYSMSNLEFLSLAKNQIADPSGLVLHATPQLIMLNLSNNQITSASSLATLEKLTTLNISSNKLASLEGLESLQALERLDISNNPDLTIEHVFTLSTCSNLKTIKAAGIELTEDLEKQLVEKLPGLQSFNDVALTSEKRIAFDTATKTKEADEEAAVYLARMQAEAEAAAKKAEEEAEAAAAAAEAAAAAAGGEEE